MSNATMITIAGNLAEAPELKVTPSGKATTRMRVAVDSRRRDQISGEWVDGPTSWYTVIAWETLAENLAENLQRGDLVMVHGRLEQRDWTTDAGETRTVWEVTAEDAGPSLRMPARDGATGTWTAPAAKVEKKAAAPAQRPATRRYPARAGNN